MRRVSVLAGLLGFVALHAQYVHGQTVCVQSFSSPTCADCAVNTTSITNFIARDGFDPQAPALGYGNGVQLSGGQLELELEGGNFQSQDAGDPAVGDRVRVAAAGDFDGDDWADIVIGDRGSSSTLMYLRFLKNRLAPGPAVFTPTDDPSDPTNVVVPDFTKIDTANGDASTFTDFGVQPTTSRCSVAVASGDFNNDGNIDIARVRCHSNSTRFISTGAQGVEVYLNPGNGDFASVTPWEFHDGSDLGFLHASSTSLIAVDYNGDGDLDLMLGNSPSSLGDIGQVVVMLNPGGPPTTQTNELVILGGPSNVVETVTTSGGDGLASIAYADVTGDGNPDIIGGSPVESTLRLWVNNGSGSFLPGVTLNPGTNVNAQGLFAADFDLDGINDIAWTVDSGPANAGNAYFIKGAGDPITPFPTAAVIAFSSPTNDLDGGAVLDYDQDPQRTPDLYVGDGQTGSNASFVLPNRTSTSLVSCGEVASGLIDLSSLPATDYVVHSARIENISVLNATVVFEPTTCAAGTNCVTFYMSNETPASWVQANDCGDGGTDDACVDFPTTTTSDVRWKAVMCTAGVSTPQLAPTLGIEVNYEEGTEHFRAGVVVHKGSIYAGGAKVPGEGGRFYAFDADLTTLSASYEVSSILDTQGASRTIFTVETDGKTLNPFDTGAAGVNVTELTNVFAVASSSDVDTLRGWFVSSRFGTSPDQTSLGAVRNSTPAVLGAPGLPLFYAFLPQTGTNVATRESADTFINNNADRYELAFWGSKDGALHAFTAASTVGETPREKWAFVPREVAANINQEMLTPTSNPHYPDGSPTLADYHDATGTFKTALVMGAGTGGEAFFALDVTEAVEPTSPFTVNVDPAATTFQPEPLWSLVPPTPGKARSKAAVVRTINGSVPQFLAVIATGVDAPGDGHDVVAVDLETGAEQWRFQAKCPVTSDIVGFETDDTNESAAPTNSPPVAPNASEPIDGFVDRIVFADNCGYVYKIDPTARPTSPDLYIPSLGGLKGVVHTDPEGNANQALFYAGDDAVINEGGTQAITDRPIYGTIAARPDSTTRVVLFFGTGGDETFDPTLQNNHFAIYADNGEVREAVFSSVQTCAPNCTKFYGGPLVTETQVAIAFSVDGDPGDPCDLGSSQIKVFSLDNASGTPDAQSTVQTAASFSGLFGGQGAIYMTLADGRVVQFGTPKQANPSAPDPGQGVGAGDGYVKGDIIAASGWRQVLY